MRIGLFSGQYQRSGSMRTAVEPLARGLLRFGHEVYVMDLAPIKSGLAEVDGINVYTLATRPRLLLNPHLAIAVAWEKLVDSLRAHSRLSRPSPKQPLAFHRFLGQLELAFVRGMQLDVLYLMHSDHVVGLCTQHLPENLFLVVNYIGFGIDEKRGGGLDTFPYQRWLFQRPFWDMQVTATQFEYQKYRMVYENAGMETEKLVNLPHCYDEDRYYPLGEADRKKLRQKYDINETELILIYPVQVYPRKNVELAIEIAEHMQAIRPTTLIVTGEFYNPAYMRQLLKKATETGLGQRIRFLNGIVPAEMPLLLNTADVTIFPSHQETFGHGMVESLGCGTPVVGPSYIRPCREILRGMPGGWLAAKDADDFCRQVQKICKIPPERELIAQAARERYSSRTIADQWANRVIQLRERKLAQRAYLEQLDWRSLYEDQLDLSKGSK